MTVDQPQFCNAYVMMTIVTNNDYIYPSTLCMCAASLRLPGRLVLKDIQEQVAPKQSMSDSINYSRLSWNCQYDMHL